MRSATSHFNPALRHPIHRTSVFAEHDGGDARLVLPVGMADRTAYPGVSTLNAPSGVVAGNPTDLIVDINGDLAP